MTAPDWLDYVPAAKSALDIIKGLLPYLPHGPKSEQAQQQIEHAESALRRAEVELAKKLGYRLCKCTFPPQIMLWRAEERVHLCGACGDRFPPAQPRADDVDDYLKVRQ